jgi:hypothetical protein
LAGAFKGTLDFTQTQLALVKLVDAATPPGVPIPFPDAGSKATPPVWDTSNVVRNILLKMDEAIFDIGENLLKGEVSSKAVEESKNKIDYLKVELKDILVSSFSLADQDKFSKVLDTMDANITELVTTFSKFGEVDSKQRATWMAVLEETQKIDSLVFKTGIEFFKDGLTDSKLDDFKQKIDLLISDEMQKISKLELGKIESLLLTSLASYGEGAKNILGSLGGGGDYDGGPILFETTGDVIT